MIAAILHSAGYRVGRFTSPHLHSYFERFMLNGQEIEGSDLKRLLDLMEHCVDDMLVDGEEHPTEFEVLTAAAFQYFAEQQVDVAVMETGLGGRYDSTNVITQPLISVITSIDYDHTDVLGHTLEEIAVNKAGIIKKGVPIVVGPIPETADQVIRGYAADLEAPLLDSTKLAVVSEVLPGLSGQEVNISAGHHHLENVWFSLPGTYQLENLACVMTTIAALEEQGWIITDEHIRSALRMVHISGRQEMVNRQPLVIMDAAHNPHAARSLAKSLDHLLPGRKRVLVCGMVDDKDALSTLEYLGSTTRCCVVTRPQGERGANWYRVYNIWEELYPDIPVIAVEDIVGAVEEGISLLQGDDYLLVTGSFYVLDRARRYFTGD